MAIIELRKATPTDASAILPLLRGPDALEFSCYPEGTIEEIVRAASYAYVGTVDGAPACVWGVTEKGFMEPAELWLTTSPLIEAHRMRFLRECRRFIAWSLNRYGWIGGWVMDSNPKAYKWIRWLGFSISDPIDMPKLGLVSRFEKRL